MIRKRTILLFIIVILTAIVVSVNLGAFKKYVILGTWKGEAVSENGNSVKTDWSKVQFTFKWNGEYSYFNSSEYLENGKYKIISVLVTDDVKQIANKYERWEYIL